MSDRLPLEDPDDPGDGIKLPRKKRRKGCRRLLSPRFLLISFTVCLTLAAFGVITAYVILTPYKEKADAYDLAEVRKVETASVVYDRNGEVLGSLFTENRRPIPIEDLSESLVYAVLATEDTRFFDHGGVDLTGMLRAAVMNFREKRIAQGASTITQQLARQTFEMREISYERKITEIFLALRIEEAYSKTEILQHYLNLIYFGNGFYGIESAALGYFGKPASDLSISESAILAALIKRPNAYNPFKSIELTTGARDRTLTSMRDQGYITRREYEDALAEPVTALDPSLRSGKGLHIMGEIRRRLDQIFADRTGSREGFQVYTSIDARLEQTLRRSVSERLAAIEQTGTLEGKSAAIPEKQPLEAAIVMVRNDTGELLASVGGRNFGRSEFDRAFNARRMMGTSFTPFIYAAAVECGVDPYAEVLDAPLDNREVMIGAIEGIVGEWGAEDYDNQYEGPISAWKAIVSSKNAATVRLAKMLDREKAIELVRRAGFTSELRVAPSSILGQTEVSPAELTLAYTSFANGGKRPERIRIIRKVVDEQGRVVYEDQAAQNQVEVMSPLTAGHVHSALSSVLEKGTGETSVRELGLVHMPAGGKTGTAYNFTDAWFLGYTSEVTCGVWVGHDRPEPIGEGAFGSVLALPVWVDVMNAAFETNSPDQIEPPEGTERVFVCDYTGMAQTENCIEPRAIPGISGAPVYVSCTHKAYFPFNRLEKLVPCPRHSNNQVPEGARIMTSRDSGPSRTATLAVRPIIPLSQTLVGNDPFGTLVPDPPSQPAIRATPVMIPEPDSSIPWRFRMRSSR